MSTVYPIENKLRPIVEFWSAGASGLTAGLLLSLPDVFLLTTRFSEILATFFMGWASLRFYQGYQIYRYQRYLKKLPYYALSSNKVPISHKKLFLGKGFRWEAVHTQRLY